MSLLFNQTCINERLLHNYTYFKIHNPAAHHDSDTQKYSCCLVKRQINYNKETINTRNTEAHNNICKQLLMIAYERSKRTQDNFSKFTHQFRPEAKTLIRKLERILIKLCRQNVSLLFNQTCLNERLLSKYTYFKIISIK